MPKMSETSCAARIDRDALPPEAKLAFLRQPSSYPESPYRVETVETHMAWVFLTTHHAYKLKKPVCYDTIDFRTIAARRHFCEEEVRLNRRLAPDVYLGVVPLTLNAGGHLELCGAGEPVDWLVRMRRLPGNFMLDYVLRYGHASERDMQCIATRLVGFFQSLAPVDIDGAAYRDRYARQIANCAHELLQPAWRLPAPYVRLVCHRQHSALDRLASRIDMRVADGKVVEGHGDLRPEHICLYPQPAIIDCLEFSRALRVVDRADEIAYLALETERLGAPALAATLVQQYRTLSHDHPPPALLHFYQGYRAIVRAALAVAHLKEAQFRYSPKWAANAMNYLQLAERHQNWRARA
jgi:aminoglycoside phosphotransferase family enzyme